MTTTKTMDDVNEAFSAHYKSVKSYPSHSGFLEGRFLCALIDVQVRHPKTFDEIVENLQSCVREMQKEQEMETEFKLKGRELEQFEDWSDEHYKRIENFTLSQSIEMFREDQQGLCVDYVW